MVAQGYVNGAIAPARRSATLQGRLAQDRVARDQAEAEAKQPGVYIDDGRVKRADGSVIIVPPAPSIPRVSRVAAVMPEDMPTNLVAAFNTNRGAVDRAIEDVNRAQAALVGKRALHTQTLVDEGFKALKDDDDTTKLEHAAALFHLAMDLQGPPNALRDLAYAATTRNYQDAEAILVSIIEGNFDPTSPVVTNGRGAPHATALKYTKADLQIGAHVRLAALYWMQLQGDRNLNGKELSPEDRAELLRGFEEHYCKHAKGFSQVSRTSPVHTLLSETAHQLGQIRDELRQQIHTDEIEDFEARFAAATRRRPSRLLAPFRAMGRLAAGGLRRGRTNGASAEGPDNG